MLSTWRQGQKRVLFFPLLAFPVLFSGFNLTLKFTLSNDTVRNQIVPALEQKLGRKVGIDKIDVSLISGIEITNFTIGNPEGFSPAPLFQAKRITLKYELLPLLLKKVVVRGAAVSEPAIFIEKGPNGLFNFDGLGRKALQPKPSEGGKSDKGNGPLKMAMSEASLENGSISLFLPGQDGEKPYHLRLEKVRVALQNISKTEPVELEMSVTLADSKKSNLELKGEIMLDGSRVDVTLKGKDVSLAPLLGLTPAIKGTDFSQGRLEFDTRIIALETFSKLSSEGGIQLIGLNLPVLGRRADLDLQYRMSFQRDKAGPEGQPRVRQAVASVGGPPSGKEDFKAAIEVLGLAIHLQGSPEMRGKLAGQLTLDPNKLSGSHISLDLGHSRFMGSLSIEPRGEKDFVAFDVATPFMDLDELISLSLPGKKETQEPGRPATRKKSSRADAWVVSGEFRADKVNYTGLVLEEVKLKVAAKDGIGKGETVGRLASGSFFHQGEVNFNEPDRPYQTRVELNEVKMESALPWLFPGFSLIKKGTLSSQVHIAGRAGVLPRVWGDLRMSQGQLAELNFLRKYEEYLGAKNLEAFDFTSVRTDFTLEEGQLRLKDTELTSPELTMTGQGRIDLRGRQVEYQVMLNLAAALLPPSLVPALVDRFLPDDKGWLKVPVRIYGELASPLVALSEQPTGDHN